MVNGGFPQRTEHGFELVDTPDRRHCRGANPANDRFFRESPAN